MDIQVNIGEAKDRLSQLVAAAERGERVVIARSGKAAVRLVAEPTIEPGGARAELKRRLDAFEGSFSGRLDMSLDWASPSMTEAQIRVWEQTEDARYKSDAA